jgi:hypothetical protein
LSHFTSNENEELSRRCFLCDTALAVVGLAALGDETAARQARPGDQKLMDEMLKTLDDPRITHQRVTFQNGADEIQAFLARPKAAGRRRAVVVIPGDFGMGDYTRVTVAQLAQQGFVALGLDTFSRASKLTSLQEARRVYFDVMTDALTLQDIQAAIAYRDSSRDCDSAARRRKCLSTIQGPIFIAFMSPSTTRKRPACPGSER